MSLLYLVAVQAIFNFAVRPQGICSVEFHDTLCTYKLEAAKYGKQVSPAYQLQ